MNKSSRSDRGASSVEHALLISAVGAIIVILLIAFGTVVYSGPNSSCDSVAAADPSTSC